MKLVLLLSFLAVASAASIGSEKCTWGPAYWCDHPLKAKECGEGATTYCIANDWTQLKVDDGSACDDCELFLADVKAVLNNGTVQTEIINVIKELCNKLGSEAETCKLVVDLYGMRFLEELITDLDASKVCKLLDLCKSSTRSAIEGPQLYQVHVISDPDVCVSCKQIFSDLDDILANKSIQSVIFNATIKFCIQAGVPQDLCRTYVDEYGPEVFKYIIQLLNGDMICQEMGVCSNPARFDFLKKITRANGDSCSDCKQIFSVIDDLLSNSAIVSSYFQNEVLNLCLKTGLFPNDVCQEMDKYTPVFMKYFATLLNGEMICGEIGLCSLSARFGPMQLLLNLRKVPSISADPCTDCKQIFSDLDNLLTNKSVQQYVQKEVLQVCSEVGLPGDVCQAIGQYVPEALNYLAGLMDGGMICSELGVCASTVPFNPQQLFSKLPKAPSANGDTCTECKTIFSDLQDILNNQGVQTNLFNTLISVCETLGVSADSCTSAIDTYGSLVLDELIPLLDGNTICPQQHLCGAGTLYQFGRAVTSFKQVTKSNGDPVQECQEIITDLLDILGNQTVQKDILNKTIAVCEALGIPPSTCTEYVNQFGPVVLQELQTLLTPSFCTSGMGSRPKPVTNAIRVPPPNGNVCTECLQMLKDLEDILSNSTVQTNLLNTLGNVCSALGIPSDTCNQYIMQYGPMVLQILTAELDGTILCPNFQLCAPGAVTKLIHAVSAFKKIVVSANGDPCSECKEVVMDLSDILNNQTVQGNIFKEVVAVCVALGIPADTCSNVNTYGPVVLQVLEGLLTPSLCTNLQLCAATNPKPLYLPEKSPPANGDTCTECKTIFSDLQDILNNQGIQTNLFNTLISVCETLGVSADSCTSAIDTYGSLVLDELIPLLDGNTICPQQHLCGAGTLYQFGRAVTSFRQVTKSNRDPVQECQEIITDLLDILGNQTVQKDILNKTIAVCEALGIPPSTCTEYVNQFGPVVLQEIQTLLTPSFCTSGMGSRPKPVTNAIRVQPPNGNVCTECLQMLKDLEDILSNSTVQTNLLNTLVNVCSALGIPSDTCNQYIMQYGPMVLQILTAELDGTILCPNFQLCAPGAVTKLIHAVSAFKKIVVSANGDPCSECKEVVMDLSDILNNQTVQGNIFKEVVAVCVALGIPADTCSNVNTFGPVVLQVLEGLLTPSLCTNLQLCAATNPKPLYLPEKSPPANGDTCTECKTIFSDLQDILNNQGIQTNLFNTLISVCETLGVSADSCTSAIDTYGSLVLDELIPLLDGNTICPQQHLCGAGTLYQFGRAVTSFKQVTKSNGDPVKECQVIVVDLLDILSNQTVQQDILNKSIAVCEALGISSAACIEYVNDYGPLVLQEIETILTPSICSSGEGNRPKPVTKVVQVPPPNGDVCTECLQMLKDLEDILSNTTVQTNLLNTLVNVCSALGIPSDTCNQYIMQYGPMVLQILTAELDGTVLCPNFQLCAPGAVTKLIHAVSAFKKIVVSANGDPCSECKEVVMDLSDILNNQTVQGNIFKEVVAVCVALGIPADTCSNVNTYGPVVLQVLEGLLTPSLCTNLQLCAATNPKPLYLPEKMAAVDLVPAKPVLNPVSVPSTNCIICEYLMDLLELMYPTGATSAQLETYMYQACKYLTEPEYVKTCNAFVTNWADRLIQELITLNFDYDKACPGLNICPDVALEMKAQPNVTTCEMCQFVTDYLSSFLPTDFTKEEIQNDLNQACNILPGNLGKECTSFVSQYGDKIIELLLGGTQYQDICSMLKVCPSLVSTQDPIGDVFDCAHCVRVKAYLVQVIKPHVTKEQVGYALDAVCFLLGGDVKGCTEFVAKYRKDLTNYLLSGKPVSALCTGIGVCSAAVNRQKTHVGSSIECAVCELVMKEVEGELKKNATEEDIEKFLDNVCDILPSTLKTECDAFIAKYTQAIVALLKAIPPDEICQTLGLCTSSASLAQSSPVQVGSSIECTICTEVMKLLEAFLEKNRTTTEVENFLEKICDVLPSQYKTECDMFVKEYVPEILQLLGTYPPDKICEELKLCSSSKASVAQRNQVQVGSSVECLVCDEVTKLLEAFLEKNRTQADIENFLDNICDILPGAYKTECNQFINTYISQIVKLVVAEFPPDKICDFLGVCSSSKASVAQRNQVQVGSSVECLVCDEVTKLLEAFVEKNRTQADIENFLDNVCDILPGAYKTECNQFINTYMSQIVKLVVAEFPPDKICDFLGVCSSSKASLAQSSPVQVGSSIECTICTEVMKLLEAFLEKNRTTTEVENFLEKICDVLPSQYKTECDMFVKEYVPEILQLLGTYPPDKICEELKLCSSSKASVAQRNQVQVGSSVECLVCDEVTKLLEAFLEKNRTQADIENFLDNICDILPGAYKTECNQFINTYISQIVKLVVAEFPPDKICEFLGVCSSSKASVAQRNQVQVGSSVECLVCDEVTKLLEAFVEKNRTQADIENFLDNVCDILPGAYKTECNQFINTYISQIVKLVVAEFPPDKICDFLGVCSSSKASLAQSSPVQVGSSIECTICTEVMKLLEAFLEKNRTTTEVENFLEKICDVLPSQYKTECDMFVKEYVPEILQLLGTYPPDKICEELKLCSSSKASVAQQNQVQVGSSVECLVCDEVTKLLEAFLEKNRTQADVENFLDNICDILPGAYKTECNQFINTYISQIVKLVVAEFPPDKICDFLGVCSSSKASVAQRNQVQVGSSVECLVCDEVTKLLEAFLEKNRTQANIENFLDNICDILPGAYKTECNQFINTYISQIVKLVVAEFPPDKICEFLGVCSSSKDLEDIKESTKCLLCELVMKEVDQLLDTKASQAEIEKVLEKVCSLMPSTIRTECEDFVKEYAPQIIQLLLQYVSPSKVCDGLKLCTSLEVKAKLPGFVGGVACGPCEMVVEHLEIILKERSTQKEVEDFLKNEVCAKMPGETQKECISVVDKYLPEILELVTSMTPEELCGLLGLCSSVDAMDKMLEAAIDSTAECMICELVVKEVRSGLSQNATEGEIQKLLDTVCSKVPLSSLAKDCQEFVDDYTKPIIQYLLAEMDPDKICDFLKVCDQSKITSPIGKTDDDTLCLVCDVLFGILETQLATNKSYEEVTQFIENVCTILPDSLDQQCNSFLDLYGPVLLQLIVNDELSPNEICKDLRLCTSSSLLQPRLKFNSGSSECDTCKEVVTLAEDLIKDNKDKIIELLAKICDLLPEAEQQECKNYLEVYGSYVLDLIIDEYFAPATVCKDLKMCSQSLQSPPPANKCMRGPVFWCASMDNAKLCNTVEHCRRHVWN